MLPFLFSLYLTLCQCPSNVSSDYTFFTLLVGVHYTLCFQLSCEFHLSFWILCGGDYLGWERGGVPVWSRMGRKPIFVKFHWYLSYWNKNIPTESSQYDLCIKKLWLCVATSGGGVGEGFPPILWRVIQIYIYSTSIKSSLFSLSSEQCY